MLDDRFEDQMREAAQEYHAPPATPREEMWAAIEAERAKAEGAEEAVKAVEADNVHGESHKILPFRSYRFAAGIAAILALGIGLGRLSVRNREPAVAPAVSTREAPRASSTAYHVATTEHLSQSEAFLTLFRASVRRGGDERLASATARQLLATNRLLLDSPAATDRRTRLLLQDLELVLAEIAQLSPRPRSRDLDLITQGLEQGGMLSRLRTAVPSGAGSTQGAL
jgi:hypothetical protein